MTVRADPPVRRDNRCAHCGNPRTITREARRYAGDHLDADPFCSSTCCRDWHGLCNHAQQPDNCPSCASGRDVA